MDAAHEEIEVRFLEVAVESFKKRLQVLRAEDLGEDLLREIIFYDSKLLWKGQHKRVRMRERNKKIFVTFKHNEILNSLRTKEIEFESNDWLKTKAFLEALGLVAYRIQEKKRHTFMLNDVTIDIDKWPGVPAYVELEGPSEAELRSTAQLLGLDWNKAVFRGAAYVLEHYYHIPVTEMREFTFASSK